MKPQLLDADASPLSAEQSGTELSEDARAALRLTSESLRGLATLGAGEQQRVAGLIATMAIAIVSKANTDTAQTLAILERVEAVVLEARRRA